MIGRRPAAVAIISAIALLLIITIIYYTRSQGGVLAAGTDAKQTGQRYNPHLTNDINEMRARRIRVNAIRDRMQMQRQARAAPKAVSLPPSPSNNSMFVPDESIGMDSTSTPPTANDTYIPPSATQGTYNAYNTPPPGPPGPPGPPMMNDIPVGEPVDSVDKIGDTIRSSVAPA